MIKKTTIVTILTGFIMVLFVPVASAYPGGLLDGKQVYDGGNQNKLGSLTSLLTDNNSGTGIMTIGGWITYIFDSPVNLTSFLLYAHANNGSAYFIAYDETGREIKRQIVPNSGHYPTNFDFVASQVKKIEFRRPSNFNMDIRELDVFGSYGPPQMPTGLIAKASPGQVILTWDEAPGALSYNVYLNGSKVNSSPIENTTYTITGLADNVTYSWQVASFNGEESTKSEAVITYVDTIPPEKPKGIIAIPQPGQIHFQWIANRESDLLGYYLYRNGTRINSEPITGNQYIINSLPGIEHDFSVSAVDKAGNESAQSDTVTAAALIPPDTTPPAAPTGLKAAQQTGSVRLTWNANGESDLAGYFIYRNGIKINQEPITTTNYNVIGGMSWGIGYRFEITAVDQAGNESPKSEPVTAAPIKPDDVTPPATPQGLTGSISSDALMIMLSWNANIESDLAGYNLFVSLDGIAYQKVNGDPITGTNYEYGGIDGNTRYYFRLTAVDENGNESKQTAPLSIKTPTRETSPILEPTKPKLIITWAPVHGAVQYLIYYQDQLYAVAPSNATQHEITLAEGYDPEAERQKVTVKAKFLDGSIGQDPPGGERAAKKWGFGPADIFTNSMFLIGTLAGFVLFGLLFRLLPWFIQIIKDAATRRRGAGA